MRTEKPCIGTLNYILMALFIRGAYHSKQNLVHFRKNLKQSYRKIQKSYKNPQSL